ncbi:MAG: iron ABC transporter permease [Brumimicrobium sp.]
MQNKRTIFIIAGLLLLAGLAIISLQFGAYKFQGNLWDVLVEVVIGKPASNPTDSYVFFSIRLPRIVMSILVGSALAVSGTALQGMFKNPLATPNLIGVTAGASLFAAITIVLGSYLKSFIPDALHFFLLSIMAFLGAIITMIFVYRISTTKRKTNVVIMLLAGVAITALSGAITGFLTYLTDEEELRDLIFWTLGSLGGSSWLKVGILAVVILLAYSLLLNKGKALNAMMLGEQDATHLGVPVEKIKKQIIVLTALLVGTCVAFTGTIGFVGLIIPYILRLIFSSNYYIILPLSAIGGGVLLLIADTLSRVIVAPTEMPIGVLTAFLGTPIFIAILIRHKKLL